MKKVILLIGCMVILAGCTKSNIVTPDTVEVKPNFEIVEGVELDQEQIADDLSDYMSANDNYSCGKSVEASSDEEENVTIHLVVADDTTAEDAAGFASYMVKAYADAVATQDFSYKNATEDTYGTYFDTHSVHVTVAPESTKDDISTWLIDQTVEAGTNEPIKPLEK